MKLKLYNPTGEPIPEPMPFDMLSEQEQVLIKVFRACGLDVGPACEYMSRGASGGYDRQPTEASVPFQGRQKS